MSLPPGWYADPSARYPERFHDGARWTAHVKDGDTHAVDQPDPDAPAYPMPSPPAALPIPEPVSVPEPAPEPAPRAGRVVLVEPGADVERRLAELGGTWLVVPLAALAAMQAGADDLDPERLHRGYHAALTALAAEGIEVLGICPGAPAP